MGAYASSFRTNTGKVVEKTTPRSADWITAHATITRLTVVEVERLWLRFQQLGCNEQGQLTLDAVTRPPISNDIFIKLIIMSLMTDTKMITFQCFLNLLQWAEVSSLETKLRGIFHLINGGKSLTRDSVVSILRQTYYEDSADDVDKFADILFRQIDKQRRGYIDEEMFIAWVRSLPVEAFEILTTFSIVPPEVNEDAHRSFSTATNGGVRPIAASIAASAVTINDTSGVPTNESLETVASKVQQKDWYLLANKLNFTTKEMNTFEKRHAKDRQKQVLEMLRFWKQRDGSGATCEVLTKALQNSNMSDVIPFVHS